MAKMLAKTQIIMPDGKVVAKGTVFDATPAQARQFDALKSARQATPAEIEAADRQQAAAVGHDYTAPELPLGESKAPPSGAPGDPNGVPKGKSV
jgi:hypothetical protein